MRLAIVMSLDFLAVAATMLLVLGLVGSPLRGGLLTGIAYTGLFAAIVTSVFYLAGLYGQSWRYMRFRDWLTLGQAIVLGLAAAWIAALAVPSIRALGNALPAIAILHVSTLLVTMGSMRAVRRYMRERRQARQLSIGTDGQQRPKRYVLLHGPPEWASSVIELIRGDAKANLDVVGVLLSDQRDFIGRLSGVPVLGGGEMLPAATIMLEERRKKPSALIICDDGQGENYGDRARLIERARKLGLELGRVTDPWSQLLQASPKIDIEGLPTTQLLGREEYSMDQRIVESLIRGRRVLVTGAGGTIGGELVKQLAEINPAEIALLDHAEHSLYQIEIEVRQRFPTVVFHQVLCSVRDRNALRAAFQRYRPEFVFHAAALKHVPIVEVNPCAGVHTNVIGTRNVADAVCEFGVKAMVQVSTDKAVNPVGMMGATKRVGELYCQALDLCGVDDPDAPRYITVRFGNVLGSSGSIVPLFKRQIAERQPLTVTHPEITRFFMTVKEAVQLILRSSCDALQKDTMRGSIYVLDMGKPVRILDMARQMIRLAGLEPEIDIGIRIVGLRPGEKLYEQLFDTCEERVESEIEGIFEARSRPIPLPLISEAIDRLHQLVLGGEEEEIKRITHNLIKLPNGSADTALPFGNFSSHMARFMRERFMVVS